MYILSYINKYNIESKATVKVAFLCPKVKPSLGLLVLKKSLHILR